MNNLFASAQFNGDISKWEVSRVTNMNSLFSFATSFNSDISKWDVSNTKQMPNMFWFATSFNCDISNWDVSSVEHMSNMFARTANFDCDISKWDVSSVTNMDQMFLNAVSFKQQLCGVAWVNSEASKSQMFLGSSGSIAQTVCPSSASQRWLARWQSASTPIATSTTTLANALVFMGCPNCGTFKKSGRFSCCALGGSWYKNCGSVGNANLVHSWLEGAEACKCKYNANS